MRACHDKFYERSCALKLRLRPSNLGKDLKHLRCSKIIKPVLVTVLARSVVEVVSVGCGVVNEVVLLVDVLLVVVVAVVVLNSAVLVVVEVHSAVIVVVCSSSSSSSGDSVT